MKTTLMTILLFLIAGLAGCSRSDLEKNMVLLPVSDDPTISFRLIFRSGSQNDPPGKEGLANLTAAMLAQGATQKHSYEEVLEILYPMAASISVQMDKELTVFSGRVHQDNLTDYYALLKEVLLQPAFSEEDFNRLKSDALNYLQKSLRYAQDEELGKEALSEFIYTGTPYGHVEEGHVSALNGITLNDVRQFYQQNYTRANLIIGLGGGYPAGLPEQVASDFEVLPAGGGTTVAPAAPPAINGLQVEIVEKDAQATAISFGFPINVLRGSRDFYALAIATSYLGEHRNSSSHLYQVIREKRGLNYGDYAYIEHFPLGHARQFPPPNVARQQQLFQIWIRPVPNEARLFAFRAALRELQRLVDNGMTPEQFELTRKFLKSYILNYAVTTDYRLGYAIDDHLYGIAGGHWATFQKMLDELTLEDVNTAIRRHWQYQNIKAVFVTTDAEALKEALVNNAPSPIKYESPKPAEILEEDKEIASYPIAVSAENVRIVKVDELFE